MKFLLIGGVAVNAGDLFQQIPTIVLAVIVFGFFVLLALVLCNESACNRLIRMVTILYTSGKMAGLHGEIKGQRGSGS